MMGAIMEMKKGVLDGLPDEQEKLLDPEINAEMGGVHDEFLGYR